MKIINYYSASFVQRRITCKIVILLWQLIEVLPLYSCKWNEMDEKLCMSCANTAVLSFQHSQLNTKMLFFLRFSHIGHYTCSYTTMLVTKLRSNK